MDQRITGVVESAIKESVRRFTDEPARFFTESDLVCDVLRHLASWAVPAEPGVQPEIETVTSTDSSIVNTPPPSAAIWRGSSSSRKGKDDPTPKGGRFRRGFCDVVVFNPELISAFSYPELKAQDFELYKNAVVPSFVAENHSLLHGVEFVFKRDVPRGRKQEDWATRLVAEVLQDADKLQACLDVAGFMARGTTLVFVKGTNSALRQVLQDSLRPRADVTLHFAD